MFFRKVKGLVSTEDLRNNVVLLPDMKCAACVAYMQPPIVQCVSGHSICKTCVDKSSTCAICGNNITNTRNLHLENMATKVKYPCRNAAEGCESMFSYSELNEHEKRCGNRMYICQLGNYCQWSGPRSNLPAHVHKDHTGEIIMQKNTHLLYKKFKEAHGAFTRLINAFGEVFWYHHLKTRNSVHWAVQYLGPDVKARNFAFDFKIINPEDSKKYVGFKKVSCLDSSDDPDDEFENARCVKLNLDVVKNFANLDGNIMCHIEIKRYKHEKDRTALKKKQKQDDSRISRNS